jgi:peptidoglycan/xylan/chitin deacetylase (PgdA/CDA1 family)
MRNYLIFIILLARLGAQAQHPVKWPGHHKAAIVLTYDDALESQLTNAVPQLRSQQLKATFFLTADIDTSTIPKWKKLSNEGYELGNHTLYHPCLSTEDNPVPSENYTIEKMLREIEIMNNYLYAIDGHTSRTFAYPCSESTAGKKDYVDSLRDYGLVKYARTGGDTDDVITDFSRLDLLRVPSYGLEGNNTTAELIGFVKKVEKAGGLGIFMFHGIGGDYLSVAPKIHYRLLRYLKKHQKTIWVTTFKQAMDYATSKRESKSNLAKLIATHKNDKLSSVAGKLAHN